MLLAIKKSYSYTGVDEAFSEFIRVLYVNTESARKSNKLCVFGYDGISSILEAKEIKDLRFIEDKDKNYDNCRIIYVAKNKSRIVRSFIGSFNKAGAVTVATFDEFVVDGGMIMVDIGRRNFELTVNSEVFSRSSAKIDSSITALIISKR